MPTPKIKVTKALAKKPRAKSNAKSMYRKYDWNELKLGFLMSKVNTVGEYIQEKTGVKGMNGNFAEKTAGWLAEKNEMKKEALAEAKEELKKQMKQDLYKPSMEELSEMHKGIMQILKAGITFQYQRMFKKDKEGKLLKDAQGNLILETGVDTSNLKRMWEMVKAEKLEPTATSLVQNSISDEEYSFLEGAFGEEENEESVGV